MGPGIGQARIHIPFSTVLKKSVGFFIINIFLVIKMLSKLKSGKCWARLASVHYNMQTDLDEIIRLHLRRMKLANIQNPMERGL